MTSDTRPEAERIQIEILRKLSGDEKLELAAQLRETSVALMAAGLRDRFRADSDEAIQQRIRRIILGDKLYELAYGPK